MKKKSSLILSLVVSIFCFNSVFAKTVEITKARQVAINCYVENSFTPLSEKSVSISDQFTITKNSYTVYYVFNITSGGFVMVSADDAVTPILGYSYEGYYSDKNHSPEFDYWMGTYEDQIVQAIATGYIASTTTNAEWSRLAKNSSEFSPVKGAKDVAPFCNSTWDQGNCYNDLCPADATSSAGNGIVWAGCVATSMAQVMYYYRYPTTGQGSHSYSSSYGTLSVNCGATTYDWNAMTNSCVGSNNAIATLIYHAGVTVNMGYSPTGSGAQMFDAASSLTSYFKYASAIDVSKWGYTDAQWETLLKTDLDLNRPLIYSGSGSNGGHAWVCDGYQGTNYFHFNWGWSGAYNGYFYLNNLSVAGDDFTSNQDVIHNIYPPASGYPYYCSGTTNHLTAAIGTFEDGSGPSNYQNNDDCSWLISPAGIDHLNISFVTLNTEATNDKVTIYDGPTTSSPVLGSYSGSTIPGNIISSNDSVLVKFTSDASTTGTGWQIYYNSSYPVLCTGVQTMTAASDTFSDGSGTSDYNNSSNCQWLIQPTNAASVTLHFIDFNTEATNDRVRVIDAVNSTLLATYSGTSLPATVTSPSGQMRVIFSSNATITSSGWSAYYTSTPSGVEDFNSVKQLSVYPNPVKDRLHVSFTMNDGSNSSVQLLDLTGQIVYSENISDNNSYSRDIDIASFSKGVYILKINTSGETLNKKIVIE